MIQVAAYCRVSTDKEDQANSFETQQRYFREWIDRNPEWMLQEIYADEGISGTNTKKRTQFNRMIRAAPPDFLFHIPPSEQNMSSLNLFPYDHSLILVL